MNRAPDDDLAGLLADWAALWSLCDRAACRRARACRDAAVPCFSAHTSTVLSLALEDAAFQRLFELAYTAEDEPVA